MKGSILSEEQVNDIKIAIAILWSDKTSIALQDIKIWELFDLLMFDIEVEIPEDGEEINMANMIPIPFFILAVEDALVRGDLQYIKKLILERLIQLEAYEEIIELGLDKINRFE